MRLPPGVNPRSLIVKIKTSIRCVGQRDWMNKSAMASIEIGYQNPVAGLPHEVRGLRR